MGEAYPESELVHFYRNIFTATLSGKRRSVAAMLKAIHASENLEAARKKVEDTTEKLRAMKLNKAVDLVESSAEETFSYYASPLEHWRSLRINNPLERINREIRRRTRIVGSSLDGN